MRRRRQQRRRRTLAVPAMPGTGPYGMTQAEPPAPSAHQRALRLGIAVAGLAAIVITTLLLARDENHPSTAPATTVATVATTPAAHHGPTAAQKERTAARRLAAALPVALESAALLRKGDSLYVVGGTTQRGKPAAGIWRIDLKTRKVKRVGTFLEPLTDAGSARQGGVLYLAGGWTGEKLATAILRWSPGESAVVVARLPVAARGEHAVVSAGQLYVVKGKKAYVVDIDAGTVKAAKIPAAKLRAAQSNLDYLVASLHKL